mgnify:FL=1
MKKKLLIITVIIAIIGALVVIFKGFNVSFNYRAHKSINIPINADFNIEDIQVIADEVFGKKNTYLEKAGVFNDSVVINVKDVSDDQLSNLKNKINEKYQPKQKITISIGKEDYNVDDIKAIANEVFAKEDSVVEKSADNAKNVTIEANIITNDELEKLNSKINEKYGLTNETSSIGVTQVITVNEIPRVRLTDMAKQYGKYTAISAVVILVYFAIRFKKLGVIKTILGSIISIILAEVFYMAIIAITRYPVDKMVIIGSIAIYIFVVTYLNKNFLLRSKKLTNKK